MKFDWKQVITAVLVCVLTVFGYHHFFKLKIVSADVLKVANEFKLKLDLEKDQKNELEQYKKIVDSLKNNFEYLYKQNKSEAEMKKAYEMAFDAETEFNQILQALDEENNMKIWNRLNPLIDSFAIHKGYDLIIGANGMGTVLYMSGHVDVTDELLEYVNNQYENKK